MLDPTSEKNDLFDKCPHCFVAVGDKEGQVGMGLVIVCPQCGKRMMRSKVGYTKLRDALVNAGAVFALILIVLLISRYT